MGATHKVISYQLAAAASTGIATSQSGTAATPLTLNGSLVTGGVATLDSGGAARRVIITSAGNDTGITFTIVGTDRYGRPQTEVLTGGHNTVNGGIVQTLHDFLTVTSETPSGNTASTVTSGTSAVGSSAPWVVDQWSNPGNYGCGIVCSSGTTYNVEGAYDYLAPQWDVNVNTPTYYTALDGSAGGNTNASPLNGPYTLLRLTITSGTGLVTARFIQPFNAGATAL